MLNNSWRKLDDSFSKGNFSLLPLMLDSYLNIGGSYKSEAPTYMLEALKRAVCHNHNMTHVCVSLSHGVCVCILCVYLCVCTE